MTVNVLLKSINLATTKNPKRLSGLWYDMVLFA